MQDYKVHKPEVYYAAQFSVEYDDFDIEAMIKGYEAVKARIIEIQELYIFIYMRDFSTKRN